MDTTFTGHHLLSWNQASEIPSSPSDRATATTAPGIRRDRAAAVWIFR